MKIVVITADDFSLYSMGAAGCKTKCTPNLDKFANDSYFLKNYHCNIPFCQPSRAVLLTGLYPQNNGSLRFDPVFNHVKTLPAILRKNGYFTGIIGKGFHHKPDNVFNWNFYVELAKHSNLICNNIKDFIAKAKGSNYFLMINIHDPHRPFETNGNIKDEIEIPSFLSNSDDMRKEFSSYYKSVKRLDDTFGKILNHLDADIVVFTSDHGMSFPFVKGNCYDYSTNIPLMIKSKDFIKSIDDYNLTSHVDFVPTILDFLGLNNKNLDGISYLELLKTGKQDNLDYVYSQLNGMLKGPEVYIRAITSRNCCYVLNLTQNYPYGYVDGWGYENSINALTKIELKKLSYRSFEEFFIFNKSMIDKLSMRKILLSYMNKFNDLLEKKVKQKFMKTYL